jgi:hypothetical protein
MKESYWLGGSLGGFVVFIFMLIGWGQIHAGQFLSFQDEAPVTAAIAKNAPTSGIYLLPNVSMESGLSQDEMKARIESASKQWSTGPTAVVIVRAQGMPSITPSLLGVAIVLPLVGLMIAWLLSKTDGLSYWGKVGFVVATAFAAGVLVLIPQWSFYGVPQSFLFADLFFIVVGWFFGGLVMAKLCK